MDDNNSRKAAATAARIRAADLGLSARALATEAGLDSGTVGDFLAGKRWPQPTTLLKLEKALQWPSGRLYAMANGVNLDLLSPDSDESVGPDAQTDVLLSMPADATDGMTPAERAEAEAAARVAFLATAREIRRRQRE